MDEVRHSRPVRIAGTREQHRHFTLSRSSLDLDPHDSADAREMILGKDAPDTARSAVAREDVLDFTVPLRHVPRRREGTLGSEQDDDS